MREARAIVPFVPQHLVLRGNNRRRLFSYRWEYLLFLQYLEDAARTHLVAVYALALMVNHIHLLTMARTADATSKFVQSFAQRYAQHRNRRRNATGKLFEQRFESFPLLDDNAVAAVTAYIDLNPVRAGVVAHPADAPWTTYGLHAGVRGSLVPPSLWTPSPWYLGLGATPDARARAYAAWVAQCRMRDFDRDVVLVTPGVRVRRPDGTRAT
jgi:putative transposase